MHNNICYIYTYICFKSHNFSVKHNLQRPPLGRQLTTDIIFHVIERVSPLSFNFQIKVMAFKTF